MRQIPMAEDNIIDCHPPPGWEIRLRPGLWLHKLDLTAGFPSGNRFNHRPGMIDFGFLLKGRRHPWMKIDVPAPGFMNGHSGICGIRYIPGKRDFQVMSPPADLQALHVYIAPVLLGRLLQPGLGDLPFEILRVIEEKTTTRFVRYDIMDPSVHAIAHEVFVGRFSGPPRKLYLAAKSYELISLQLFRIMDKKRNSLPVVLSSSERARIREARDWLIRDMASPPTLREISRKLCLSVNKLQYGFQALFGASVFSYLREQKMQTARFLFEKTDMNVSEVAWAIGYLNISYFAKAYKKRFGLPPKRHLRAIRDKQRVA